jgi:beta-N-acetylhexosaminidase
MSDAFLSAPDASHPLTAPMAVIFGCAGPRLEASERAFLHDADPLGFILFQRNCESPGQVKDLVTALRDSVGRADAPVLIDQEGGRVARLRPPHWRRYPAAATIAALGPAAADAARLVARCIADDLGALGITVDCLPVLDLSIPGADAVIGDRSFGADPAVVAALGRAACEGLLAGGILPVIKHIPGHGRATVDSHLACPVVTEDRATLAATDFAPFRALHDMPWAMTAHVIYAALDRDHPATLSRSLVEDVIRRDLRFDGVLVSDDLSMHALGGSLATRAASALAAGCDVVLHCNGKRAEMDEVAGSVGRLGAAALRRVAAGEARRLRDIGLIDRKAADRQLDAWFGASS